MRRCVLAAGAVLLVWATNVTAQEASQPERPTLQERMQPAPVRVEAVPRTQPAARLASDKPMQPAQPMAPSNQSVALMVAGGVLFVAGAIAGGDVGGVLMLGGAVVGAYGVYLHFIK